MMRGRYAYAYLPAEQALPLARQQPGANVDEAEFLEWWAAAQRWRARTRRALVGARRCRLSGRLRAPHRGGHAIPQVATLGPRPWSVRIVDLRRVIGFQIAITEERIAATPDLCADDRCGLLRFSLQKPTKKLTGVIEGPGPNEYTVTAPDLNPRVIGNMRADAPLGRMLGFVIGGGIPWMQVVAFQGRQILRDGYHRAVGLMRAGIYGVPVARIESSEIADLGIQPACHLTSSSVRSLRWSATPSTTACPGREACAVRSKSSASRLSR